MLRTFATVAMILTVLAFFAGAAMAHDYVGSDKCKMCHKGEAKGNVWEIWENGPHAKAYQTLVAKGDGSEKNPACVNCHVTGFGKPTGFSLEGEANTALAGVGCESCHGPGADYRPMSVMKDHEKALAAGLIVPDAETCKQCHNEASPTFKGFNYEEWWAKIKHPAE